MVYLKKNSDVLPVRSLQSLENRSSAKVMELLWEGCMETTRTLVVKLWVSIEKLSFMLVVMLKPNPHRFIHRL